MRYFYISYAFFRDGGLGFGSYGKRTTGHYPSRSEIFKDLKINAPNAIPLVIQEMNEQDYLDHFGIDVG